MLNEFKKFIARGNVIDMAVGIIIGAAFVSIVNSLIADIIMPPIGLLLGNVDFSNLFIVLKGDHYSSLAEAKAAGAVTINYGYFINQVIIFLIISIVIFLFVKSINKLKTPETVPAPIQTTKECPYCKMEIPINAKKCPYCTSDLL
ncbi:MAG TPA: large-conductance mechanosensitive channel protein MscL [Bacteroidota bacterium]|nr:large-conductance mechanosensitive channel protein MscL [Bacteroidota bacterium]